MVANGDATGDNVVDIFADRAAPAARRTRPALFRARAAWAAQAMAAQIAPFFGAGGPRIVAGVAVGATVEVETSPGHRRRGVVVEWQAASDDSASIADRFPVARIRLDPLPGVPAGTPSYLRAARWRIHPVKD